MLFGYVKLRDQKTSKTLRNSAPGHLETLNMPQVVGKAKGGAITLSVFNAPILPGFHDL